MNWSSQPHEQTSAESGLPEHLLSALSSALGYLRARLELAGVEGKEAVAIYFKLAVFLIIAAVLLLFGYIFFWIGVIALIAAATHLHWGWIALAACLLHLIGAAACLWAAKAKWCRPVFSATLKEFRKDQKWLSNPRETANHN